MINPYEAPKSEPTAINKGDSRHWFNIWLFAATWPLVCISIHAMVLRLELPQTLIRSGLPRVVVYPQGALVLAGYLACVVAAARYPASNRQRLVRGAGAVLVMMFFGHFFTVVLLKVQLWLFLR